MTTRRRFAAAMAAALLLGAACANDGGGPASGGSGPEEPAATGPTTSDTGTTGGDVGSGDGGGGRYDYGPGGSDDGGSGGGETDADVTVNNYAFAPSELEAAAGSEISIENANPETPHTFTIDGTGIDVELEASSVQNVTLDLDPGSYAFRCRFHSQMTGTIAIA